MVCGLQAGAGIQQGPWGESRGSRNGPLTLTDMDSWFLQMPIAGVGGQEGQTSPPGTILGRILSGLIPCMSPHLLPWGTVSGFQGADAPVEEDS